MIIPFPKKTEDLSVASIYSSLSLSRSLWLRRRPKSHNTIIEVSLRTHPEKENIIKLFSIHPKKEATRKINRRRWARDEMWSEKKRTSNPLARSFSLLVMSSCSPPASSPLVWTTNTEQLNEEANKRNNGRKKSFFFRFKKTAKKENMKLISLYLFICYTSPQMFC